jgi:hypothetical protein
LGGKVKPCCTLVRLSPIRPSVDNIQTFPNEQSGATLQHLHTCCPAQLAGICRAH